MEASKLTISPDTLRFNRMTKGKRAELRKQNLIDLINSKPYGTFITINEVGYACALSYTGAAQFLSRLKKQGVISVVTRTKYGNAYVVNGDVVITHAAIQEQQPPEASVQTRPEAAPSTHADRSDIHLSAMRFVWERNSDSLHEFIDRLAADGEAIA